MILYLYKCDEHGEFEAMSTVAERKENSCPECGSPSKQGVTFANFDGRMGLDPDFATFSSKWAKRHRKAAKGE